MKTLNFFWVFLVVIQISCDTDEAIKVREFEIAGTFETISTPLSDPPVQEVRITGEGTLTHLGKTTFVAISTITLVPPPPFLLNGTSVFKVRGEEIHTEFEGTSVPQEGGLVLVKMYHTITGGTGRFSLATGALTGTTLTDRNDPKGVVEIEGKIRY